MQASKIQYILADNNLTEDTWYYHLCDIFPIIVLGQNPNVYVSKNNAYRFNSTNQLLEVVHGTYINNIFTDDNGNTDESKFTPDHFITYEVIAGLSKTSTII